MRMVPDLFLFEPWTMPSDVQLACGIELGRDIPIPLVDLDAATREAKAKLFAVRGQSEVKAAKSAVVKKQGPRSSRGTKRSKNDAKKSKPQETHSSNDINEAPQLGFDF